MFKETKKRTITKAITWRIIATLNSYIILILFVATGNVWKAILMNISGFFIFYTFERIWNKIKWEKVKE
jgi:uncharacterized membrane protein